MLPVPPTATPMFREIPSLHILRRRVLTIHAVDWYTNNFTSQGGGLDKVTGSKTSTEVIKNTAMVSLMYNKKICSRPNWQSFLN